MNSKNTNHINQKYYCASKYILFILISLDARNAFGYVTKLPTLEPTKLLAKNESHKRPASASLDDDDLSFDDLDAMTDEEFQEALHKEIQKRIQQVQAEEKNKPHDGAGSHKKEKKEATSSSSSSGQTFSMGGGASAPVQKGAGGYKMGGGPPNGVVPNPDLPRLSIDPQTGEGSEDLIKDFNFQDTEIIEIAKSLASVTGSNLVFDKDVKGKVSIVTNNSVTVRQAWGLLLTSLDMFNYAIIHNKETNYIRIAKKTDAREKALPIYYPHDVTPNTNTFITKVIDLKFLAPSEVAEMFRYLMPSSSKMIAFDQTNSLVVIDDAMNIQKLEKVLKRFDKEGFEATVRRIKIENDSPERITKLIDTLIPANTPASRALSSRSSVNQSGGFSSRKTKDGGVISAIVADERTGSLLVYANKKGYDRVLNLVKQLDQPNSERQGNGKIRVHFLQFGDATQIAATLTSLIQNMPGKPSGGGGGGIPAMNNASDQIFESTVRIAADKDNNVLVITASTSDYKILKRVIDDLDVDRAQAYIEVIIMDISLQGQFSVSNNVLLPIASNNTVVGYVPDTDLAKSYQSALTNPAQSVAALIAGGGMILPFSLGGGVPLSIPDTTAPGGVRTISIDRVTDLVRILEKDVNNSILSTQNIIAIDNLEATFKNVEQIPMPEFNQFQQAASAAQPQLTPPGVQFRMVPVEVSIKIKPQINKLADFLKLQIEAMYSDVSSQNVPKGYVDTAFGKLERTAKTTLVVGDKDTVVLGGLTKEKEAKSVTKIPFLGDIPVLGWLFRSYATDKVKANLMMFLTPTIIRQYDHIRSVLDKKLKAQSQDIQRFGATDLNAQFAHEMIQTLPDIRDLSKKYPHRRVSNEEDVVLDVKKTPAEATMSKASNVPLPGDAFDQQVVAGSAE